MAGCPALAPPGAAATTPNINSTISLTSPDECLSDAAANEIANDAAAAAAASAARKSIPDD
eukprot:CAMPEP_0201893762 /NCGR_PEP_ID=MMETSP0902-20130614/39336_1 /ASSEMBLY_ACC=CAM_ASM_000551 /TAXON_ID=420261 /ORGANISM="Thalassiosira antarctica, Strain CCMP982" /LENGTH=60 /DNA_ID=CAMNT_0048425639 /DNA_START=90 /DNA_END=270 /DNA_ORIENTATION=-